MCRYIDADEALKIIKKMLYETALNNFTTDRKFADDCEEIAEHRLATWIGLVPTADVAEVPDDYNGYKDIDSAVKKTRWEITIDNGFKMYTCPECECRMIKAHYDYAVGLKGFNYCPYCGADMRGGNNDGR